MNAATDRTTALTSFELTKSDEAALPHAEKRRVRTILLLEHDETDVFFFRRTLAAVGFEGAVKVVGSVGEARDYLEGRVGFADRRYNPLPDLIVSDLRVPGCTGLEFLKWLRTEATHRGIAFVMYSCSLAAGDAERSTAAGAQAFICKPVDFAESMQSVRAILGHLPVLRRSNRLPGHGPCHREVASPALPRRCYFDFRGGVRFPSRSWCAEGFALE